MAIWADWSKVGDGVHTAFSFGSRERRKMMDFDAALSERAVDIDQVETTN